MKEKLSSEVKPCPFCGTTDLKLIRQMPSGMGPQSIYYTSTKWKVFCQNEECLAVGPLSFSSREEAEFLWNKRD